MSGTHPPLTLDLRKVALLSWRMLTARERVRVMLLAVGMTVNGVLQSFSLAALLPFIAVLLDPSVAQRNHYVASLSHFFGDPEPRGFLIWCAVGLLAVIAAKNACELAYNYALSRLVAVVEKRVSVELLRQCLTAPYIWFLSKNTALLVKAVMGDIVIWGRAGLKGILSLSSSVIALGSIGVVLLSINPQFGIGIGVVGLVLSLGIMKTIRSYVRTMARVKHEANDEAYKVINHALSGAKDIKINGKEEFFLNQFAERQEVFVSHIAKLATVQHIPAAVIEMTVALAVVGIGVLVSNQPILRSEMVALLAVYGVAIIRVLPVFNQISLTVNSVHGAIPAIENIHRTQTELAAMDGHAMEQTGMSSVESWDRLSLNDVAYAYPGGRGEALAGIDLAIERGWRIGVVGRSGAGKTTLVDIVTGLLFPTRGRVLVGGEVLHAGNAPSWRQHIGYVPQSPFIADETLRFNVALGMAAESVDDGNVVQVLEAANFGDVLRRELRDGLDTQLGERGVRLSGGQRQRVAIARALYREPSLLILDEATSALDSESERMIAVALSRISRNVTILIVAHRLSTIRDCDRIVVLDKGSIVGFDTHVNLMRTCPLYRRFVELGDMSLEEAGRELDSRAV